MSLLALAQSLATVVTFLLIWVAARLVEDLAAIEVIEAEAEGAPY